jgi:hypothetical protein
LTVGPGVKLSTIESRTEGQAPLLVEVRYNLTDPFVLSVTEGVYVPPFTCVGLLNPATLPEEEVHVPVTVEPATEPFNVKVAVLVQMLVAFVADVLSASTEILPGTS